MSVEHAIERKNPRVDLPRKVDVFNEATTKHLGCLVNISLDGIMILGSHEVEVKRLYELVMHLTNPAGEDCTVCCVADCLWTKTAGDDISCWSGFHIIDIDEDNMQNLKSVIDFLSGEQTE